MASTVVGAVVGPAFEDDRQRCHHVGPVPVRPSHEPYPSIDETALELTAEVVEEEAVDAVPVLAEVRAIERASPASLPVVRAPAAAATGFVAGAATLAILRRHSARKLARTRLRPPKRGLDALPIVGTRSFLVDVHLIAKPGE
jgi:hypothetical protein